MTWAAFLRAWAVPVALAGLTLANGARSTSGLPEPVPLSVAVLVVAALVLGLRRERPVSTVVTASVLVTCYLLMLHGDLAKQPAIEPFLVMVMAFFSLGAHAPRATFPLGAAASALPLVVVELAAVSSGRPFGEVFPTLLFWGAALVLGRLLHHRSTEVVHTRERLLEAERQATQAAAEERARIARELHDVVAHGLSVVVLHAGVERRLLDDPGSSAWQTLDTIERTARTALTELRQLLGLLQQPGDHSGLEPLPSLNDLDQLLAPVSAAGHEVTVELSGSPGALPSGLALSAYRIVQEAVTNALKHAPGSAVAVWVDDRPDAVVVEVENDAGPVPAGVPVPGGGNGLIGMRERVRVYGGELTAESSPDGGFLVRAVLPREAL
jgi:signal transduction histidine kinase